MKYFYCMKYVVGGKEKIKLFYANSEELDHRKQRYDYLNISYSIKQIKKVTFEDDETVIIKLK